MSKPKSTERKIRWRRVWNRYDKWYIDDGYHDSKRLKQKKVRELVENDLADQALNEVKDVAKESKK